MKISLNWINDFVDLDGVSPEQVSELLSLHTAEVEGVEVFGEAIGDVVVGEVIDCEQHPNADKLSVTKVSYGADEEAQVVCGAPNVRKGLRVAFAPVGSKLPGDFKIKKAKLRGVVSMGMICSERELELSDEHAGIMELPDDAPVGAQFIEYANLLDHVLELDNKSLTHRPDLWGHYGFAREIAALLGRPLRPLETLESWPEANATYSIKLQSPACPKYYGLEIDLGGKPRPSADLIRQRLLAVGQRPINDVVDLSNYVLQEIGQPTHAFDTKKLSGKEVLVRAAKEGEALVTLDEIERNLQPTDLVIADHQGAVAIAGVMGGASTEVDSETTNILLESACFDAVSVRRTSTRLALRSEASARFEKTLDPSYSEQALGRFCFLLNKYRPEATCTSAPVNAGDLVAPSITLSVDVARTSELLSLDLSGAKMTSLLESIGFDSTLNDNELTAEVPSWRSSKDVTTAIDLVEEIGRMAGYHQIEALPPLWPVEAPQQDPIRLLTRRLEDRVAGAWQGRQTEAYSFLDHTWLARLGLNEGDLLQLNNPLQDGVDLIRFDPIPSLLEQAIGNIRERRSGILFETAKGYVPIKGGDNVQRHWFACLLWSEVSQDCDGPTSLFGKGKSLASDLLSLSSLAPQFAETAASEFAWLHPNRQLGIELGDLKFGACAQIDPRIVDACGGEGADFMAVILDLEAMIAGQEQCAGIAPFNPPSKMPAIKVDIALALPCSVSFSDVEISLRKAGAKTLESIELFDIFQGGQLEEGWRSLAFHTCLRAADRTLTEKDEQKFLKRVARAAEELGGHLRS